MMVVGCGVWVGSVRMAKMTILNIKQLMLVPFGAFFHDGNNLPNLQDGKLLGKPSWIDGKVLPS
jgi:hypothetical protein